MHFVNRCWRQGIGFLKLPSCTPNPSDHQSPVWVSFILFRCASISRIPVGQPVRSSSQSSQSVFSRKCLGFQKMPASLKFARVSRKCQTIQKILELFANARIFLNLLEFLERPNLLLWNPFVWWKAYLDIALCIFPFLRSAVALQSQLHNLTLIFYGSGVCNFVLVEVLLQFVSFTAVYRIFRVCELVLQSLQCNLSLIACTYPWNPKCLAAWSMSDFRKMPGICCGTTF